MINLSNLQTLINVHAPGYYSRTMSIGPQLLEFMPREMATISQSHEDSLTQLMYDPLIAADVVRSVVGPRLAMRGTPLFTLPSLRSALASVRPAAASDEIYVYLLAHCLYKLGFMRDDVSIWQPRRERFILPDAKRLGQLGRMYSLFKDAPTWTKDLEGAPDKCYASVAGTLINKVMHEVKRSLDDSRLYDRSIKRARQLVTFFIHERLEGHELGDNPNLRFLAGVSNFIVDALGVAHDSTEAGGPKGSVGYNPYSDERDLERAVKVITSLEMPEGVKLIPTSLIRAWHTILPISTAHEKELRQIVVVPTASMPQLRSLVFHQADFSSYTPDTTLCRDIAVTSGEAAGAALTDVLSTATGGMLPQLVIDMLERTLEAWVDQLAPDTVPLVRHFAEWPSGRVKLRGGEFSALSLTYYLAFASRLMWQGQTPLFVRPVNTDYVLRLSSRPSTLVKYDAEVWTSDPSLLLLGEPRFVSSEYPEAELNASSFVSDNRLMLFNNSVKPVNTRTKTFAVNFSRKGEPLTGSVSLVQMIGAEDLGDTFVLPDDGSRIYFTLITSMIKWCFEEEKMPQFAKHRLALALMASVMRLARCPAIERGANHVLEQAGVAIMRPKDLEDELTRASLSLTLGVGALSYLTDTDGAWDALLADDDLVRHFLITEIVLGGR